MLRSLIVTILFAAMLTALGAAGAASQERGRPDDPLRILTVPEQIEECRTLVGDDRDVCIVNLALREEDPSICREMPDSRCGEIVGGLLMPRCGERFEGEERLICEVAVAKETASVTACDLAAERTACVGAVASELGDPRIIVDTIAEGRDRDVALAAYAADRRDAAAIGLIADNRWHDLALAMIASSIGVGQDRILDASYCAGMRGNYDDNPDEQDEAAVRELCAFAVDFSNFATMGSATAETAAERDAVVAMIKDIVGALERGEMDADDVAALIRGQPLPARGCAALPGEWAWFVNGTVTINADGTHAQGSRSGTWSCSGTTVHMSWSHGYEDELTLLMDGTELSGRGWAVGADPENGHWVTGTKIR